MAQLTKFNQLTQDFDLVLLFVGSMDSEDTENFDRLTIELNPNQELFIEQAIKNKKKVIVVIQSGGPIALGKWAKKVSAIVQMWLGGEASGSAISDVLVGKINPSGKLPVSFPKKQRTDLEIGVNDVTIVGRNVNNVIIDNLSIKYSGQAAIDFFGFNEDITVTNCEMGWCGGNHIPNNPCRAGGCLGFWGNLNNILVENCWAYQG